tara:strand:+ start:165 stop:1532 length:1368 start_codon:yes stop_codon:yes gene_type:complete
MKFKNKITKELLTFIPGGAHTYSRGPDTYPSNAPAILEKGKGVYIFDEKGKKYLDYGMCLRAVNIGYAEKSINKAAIDAIIKGNNLTRPSTIELRAAKLLVSLIDNSDMVKFTKNGSTSVTAAVKLARAYTGKKIVLRCAEQPFFSYDDWFIGSTNIPRGVTDETRKLTKLFHYNDIESLKKLIRNHKNKVACVVLEPSSTEHPKIHKKDIRLCKREGNFIDFRKENHFLKQVERICKENNIVFILDEMITGFRWHIKGAQHFYDVSPDISTFGKAMANGFSVSCISGKKKIMELGSITNKKQERVFLLSTTHGAEMNGLSAFIETMKFLKNKNVIKHNWNYGKKLMIEGNRIAKKFGLENFFYFSGIACSPNYNCFDIKKNNSLEFRTLFIQEMLRNEVLMPWISIAYRHNAKVLDKTLNSLDRALFVYKKALKNGVKKYLKGHVIKPVFRRFN